MDFNDIPDEQLKEEYIGTSTQILALMQEFGMNVGLHPTVACAYILQSIMYYCKKVSVELHGEKGGEIYDMMATVINQREATNERL